MYNSKILIIDELENNSSHLKDLILNNFDFDIFVSSELEDIENILRNNNINIVMIGMDISLNKYESLIENITTFSKSKDLPIFIIRDIYEQKSVKTTNFAKVEYIPFLENDALLVRKLKIYICIYFIIRESNRRLNRDYNVLVYNSRFSNISEMIKLIYDQINQPYNILSSRDNDINVSFYFNEIIKDFKKDFSLYNKRQIDILNNSVNGFLNIFNNEKNVERFNFTRTIEESIVFFKNRLLKNNIVLDLNLDNTLEHIGVKLELAQVIINILHIIVSLTNEKKLENNTIKIDLHKDKSKNILIIKDTSNNINNDILESIFKTYFKITNNYLMIDLYLIKLIIKKSFNGNLEVNNLSDGLEFKIILDSY